MMRVLWVTSEVPDLHLGGGSIRQAHLVEALARQTETHLLLADQLQDHRLRGLLASVTEVLPTGLPYYPEVGRNRQRFRSAWHTFMHREPIEVIMERPMRRVLLPSLRDVAKYDIVHVEQTHLGGLIPPHRTNTWSIDIQQLMSRRAAHQTHIAIAARHRWLAERERSKAERFERRIAAAYDLVTVSSAADAAALPGNVRVVGNGVDLDAFMVMPLAQKPKIVFTGLLHWLPNVEGLTWFCQEVLPRVRESKSDVTLDVVGRNPSSAIQRLGQIPGVTVYANVPRIQPYLERARVAVVPLRIGSGTRLKALEAMAAGRPLVGTTIGLEGLDIENGRHALIADDAATMAKAIVDLLGDDALSQRIGAAARALAEERFSWKDLGRQFVDDLFAAHHQRPQHHISD